MSDELVVGAVFVASMFMNALDITSVNVALPSMASEFDVSPSSVDWVVVAYMLSLAVWIPASGWIGDRFGTKRTLLSALVVFTIGSGLCALSTSLAQLVWARVVQGVGAGMMTPVGTAMLFRVFPPERRARASKVLLVPTVMAPALGPVVGGLLTEQLSWRWIFSVNLPIGVATVLFGAAFLREHREGRPGRFDVQGFVFGGIGLALALYALNEGPGEGWASPVVLTTGLAGVVLMVAFVVVELRVQHPLLQLRLLADRLFRSTNIVGTFAIAPFLGVSFAVPLFLQTVRGLSPLESGLTTFPEAVGVLLSSQLVARLYVHHGPRRLMVAGMVWMAGSIALLSTIDMGTSLWTVRLLMFSVGVGMAYVIMPLQAASFATIAPADMGHASAIFSTQRQVAGACGVAALATVLSSLLPNRVVVSTSEQVDAFGGLFLVASCLALVAAVSALLVHDEDAANTMVRATVSEEVAPATVA